MSLAEDERRSAGSTKNENGEDRSTKTENRSTNDENRSTKTEDRSTKNEYRSKKDEDNSTNDEEEDDDSDDSSDAPLLLQQRVPDDMINKFCDRLQEVMPEKPEGMFAMQFITREPDQIRSLITGTKRIFQIILDHERRHFVLLEWKTSESRRYVRVYDPLMTNNRPSADDLREMFTGSVRRQIISLFSHLFSTDEIVMAIVCGLQSQRDSWSCGLRAVGHLTLRACDKNVEQLDFSMSHILKFFKYIISEEQPPFDEFENAKLGTVRSTPRDQTRLKVVLNKETMEIRCRDIRC